MRNHPTLLAVAACALFGLFAGCARRGGGPAADAAAADVALPHQGQSKVPHADHNPYHGGQVSMSGDLHIELVTTSTGQYRAYLSDAVREPVTTALAREARFTITRPDGSEEKLAMQALGPFLAASGKPLGPGQVLGRLEVSYGPAAGGKVEKVAIDFVLGGVGAPVPIDLQRDPESSGRPGKQTNRPATLVR
jgi:hypothetical protein